MMTLSVVGRAPILPINKSMSNIRSDTDDTGPEMGQRTLDASVLRRRNDRTIHSGHFMLSHVHDDSSPAESSREDVIDDDSDDEIATAANLLTADTSGVLFHSDLEPAVGGRSSSHLAIDTSLTKLFECMTLAYRCVVTVMLWYGDRLLLFLTSDRH